MYEDKGVNAYKGIESVIYGGGVRLRSFDVKGDNRQFEVQNFHRVSDKLNVSLSINPRDLVCISCPEKHAFVLPDSAGIPICLNLSDQCFYPYIPGGVGERCIGCVRVVVAMLSDLERIFREVFRPTQARPVISPGAA